MSIKIVISDDAESSLTVTISDGMIFVDSTASDHPVGRKEALMRLVVGLDFASNCILQVGPMAEQELAAMGWAVIRGIDKKETEMAPRGLH